VERFAAMVLQQRQERLRTSYPDSPQWEWERVSVKPGPVYTKVDVGPEHNMSGKYMIENATGIIYGIKGYGRVHKGHRYGTLGTIGRWHWGGYVGQKIQPQVLRRNVPIGSLKRGGWLVSYLGHRYVISQGHSGEVQAFRWNDQEGHVTDWDDLANRDTFEQALAELVARPADEDGRLLSRMDVMDAQEAAERQPADQALFDRTAPKWNCVDYPGDGPHYTPGTDGCLWCGMTREQIAAEYDRCCSDCQP
jgi:hypothetical protein